MASSLSSVLHTYIVPPIQLRTSDYCYLIPQTDFNTKPKDDTKVSDIKKLVNGLLNTSGGVVSVQGLSHVDPAALDEWKQGLEEQLRTFVANQIYTACILFEDEQTSHQMVHVLVKRSSEWVTLKYNMFIRGDTGTRTVSDNQTASEVLHARSIVQPTPALIPSCKYGQTVPIAESKIIEYKHWTGASNSRKITQKLNEQRTLSCLLALPNLATGGDIYIGIDKYNTVQGQILTEADEFQLMQDLQQLLAHDTSGNSRIWGSFSGEHVQDTHWNIQFLPVTHGPDIQRRTVIWIHFNHCPGGVFKESPESYIISDDGSLCYVDKKDWRSKMQNITSVGENKRDTLPPPQNRLLSVAHQPVSNEPKISTAPTNACVMLPYKDTLSWTKDTADWSQGLQATDRVLTDLLKSTKDVLKPSNPIKFIPDIKLITNSQWRRECIQQITVAHQPYQAIAVCAKKWLEYLHMPHSTSVSTVCNPDGHSLDVLSLDVHGNVNIWIILDKSLESTNLEAATAYLRVLGRCIKKNMLQQKRNLKTLAIKSHICMPNNTWETTYLETLCNRSFQANYDQWQDMHTSLVHMLLDKPTSLKSGLEDEMLITLTKEQMLTILGSSLSKYNLIQGPAGSRKTLLALYLYELYEVTYKFNSYIFCGNPCLAEWLRYQGASHVLLVQTDEDFVNALAQLPVDQNCIIIDDGHTLDLNPDSWEKVFKFVNYQCDSHLYVFTDNEIQNFQGKDHVRNLKMVFNKHTDDIHEMRSMNTIHRNTRKIVSFIKKCFKEQRCQALCGHNIDGDDVEIRSLPNLRSQYEDNGLLALIRELIDPDKILRGDPNVYAARDIVVLVDGKNLQTDCDMYRELFKRHIQDCDVQAADKFPVDGLIVDCVDRLSGLDSKVCILVVPYVNIRDASSPRNIHNPKYKAFVASRAIYSCIFVTDLLLDNDAAAAMNIDPQYVHEQSSNQRLRNATKQWDILQGRTILDVDFLSDGSILCITWNDSMLTRFSLLGESLPLPFSPLFDKTSSISVNRTTGAVAVCGRDDSGQPIVRVWEVDNMGQYTLSDCLHVQNHRCRLALTSTGHLVMTDDDTMWMLDRDQTKLWQVHLDTGTIGWLNVHISINNKNNIILSNNCTKDISVYNPQGQLVTNFPSIHYLQDPWAVCSDSTGRVLVGDWGRQTVSLFTSQGQYIQDLVEDVEGVWCISLHRDNLLSIGRGNGMSVYKLLWQN